MSIINKQTESITIFKTIDSMNWRFFSNIDIVNVCWHKTQDEEEVQKHTEQNMMKINNLFLNFFYNRDWICFCQLTFGLETFKEIEICIFEIMNRKCPSFLQCNLDKLCYNFNGMLCVKVVHSNYEM